MLKRLHPRHGNSSIRHRHILKTPAICGAARQESSSKVARSMEQKVQNTGQKVGHEDQQPQEGKEVDHQYSKNMAFCTRLNRNSCTFLQTARGKIACWTATTPQRERRDLLQVLMTFE
jgi:hypothetical protein